MDNGTTRSSWAVVDWKWSQTSAHGPVTTNGVSILTIHKGKIARETIYFDIPWEVTAAEHERASSTANARTG